MGVLQSFSIKNISYDKMALIALLSWQDHMVHLAGDCQIYWNIDLMTNSLIT